MTDKFLSGVVAGVAGLLFVKYYVVGLEKWNATFHPFRVEDYRTIKSKA